MNQHRDIERVLDHWISDGPAVAPDRVIDVVADRIDHQPQRPAWRLDWRHLGMNTTFKLATAVAVLAIVAIVGYNLLPGSSAGVGGHAAGPTATPIASATPSPTIAPSSSVPSPTPFACAETGVFCAGGLTAGDHTSTAFQPTLRFAVPNGWQNTVDKVRAYTIVALGDTASFTVLSEVAIPMQNATCTAERKKGVGNTVADWVDFLTKHPGLTASTPASATVGGYQGMRITIKLADSWTATCPDSPRPAVVTLTDDQPTPSRANTIDTQVETFTIVDVGGTTVIIRFESDSGADFHTQMLQRVQPIIDSIRFTPTT